MNRCDTQHTFLTHDGVDIFYRHWTSTEPRVGCVILLHRGHEHSERMAHLVTELKLPQLDFFAWDARGHGHTPGVRGSAPSLSDLVRDVQTFITHIQDTYHIPIQNMIVIGQSVGAVLASTWAHDYAPPIRGLILASPAFKIKLYIPFARWGLALLQKIKGNFFVTSYVTPQMLTHDAERIHSFNRDPLITKQISVNILLDVYHYSERIVADAQAITVPTQLLISKKDWVAHNKPQHTFFKNLGSLIKEKHIFDGFFHDTLGERGREGVNSLIHDFIVRLFEHPYSATILTQSDQEGFTFQESQKLSSHLPIWSFRNWYWSAYRLQLKMSGWLSKGIALGHLTGFDSGSTLDYVYQNQPQGLGTIGRLIDQQYLHAIGWRGIRQRKRHIESLLVCAIEHLHERGNPIRIFDVAAGQGRYVLDATQQSPHLISSIVLQDFNQKNVVHGNRTIVERGMADLVTFIQGDAFSSDSYLSQKCNIGIVSGLFELFSNNLLISGALSHLSKTIDSGGYLIYTNQPWHPQLELIARTLTNHQDGKAWVMRRRSQGEMDQLVAQAGFIKVKQLIDVDGIFTVSLARKP